MKKAMDPINAMYAAGPTMTPSDPADNAMGDTMDIPMLKVTEGFTDTGVSHEGDLGGAG